MTRTQLQQESRLCLIFGAHRLLTATHYLLLRTISLLPADRCLLAQQDTPDHLLGMPQ